MGASGDKPRKLRHRMAKVPKYEETNNIQLAGLAENSTSVAGTRLGHSTAKGRSQNLGRVGALVLWCLGRRRKQQVEEIEQPQ